MESHDDPNDVIMRVNGAHLKIYHTSPSSPDGSDLGVDFADTEFLSSSPELRVAAIDHRIIPLRLSDSSIEFSEGAIDTQQLLKGTKVQDENPEDLTWNLSSNTRTRLLLETGMISFDHKLHAFTVKGTSGVPRVVTLFPKQR